jgi:hypothetical protein
VVAGALLAVLPRALARLLSDRTRLATRQAVVVVIFGLVALVAVGRAGRSLTTALPAAVSEHRCVRGARALLQPWT